jgi:hypothetical protein
VVLIDRHYNSVVPYRRDDTNIYAVQTKERAKLRYVEVAGKNLVLRPHNTTYPVQVLPLDADDSAHDFIVGRACYVGMEI